jgi:hypothetical protein
MGRLEIARLDNDPSQPENGRIEFFMEGGLCVSLSPWERVQVRASPGVRAFPEMSCYQRVACESVY